ncbi:hypothetical protein ACOME3_007127 [Neoechinorhynchus agilis]
MNKAQETNIGKEDETRTRPRNFQSASDMTKASTEDKKYLTEPQEKIQNHSKIQKSNVRHRIRVMKLKSNYPQTSVNGKQRLTPRQKVVMKRFLKARLKLAESRGETSTKWNAGEIAYKLSFGIDKDFTITSGDWVCRVFGEMIYGEFSAEEIQRSGIVPMLLKMNNNTKNIRYKYLIQKLADKFGETIREARLAAAKSSEELKASLKRKRTFPMSEEPSAAQSVDDKSAKMSESLDQKEVVIPAPKRRKYVFNCEARKSFPRKKKLVKFAGSSHSEKSSEAIERTQESLKPINHDLSFYCRGLRIGLHKDYSIWNLDWIRRMFQEIMTKEITAEEVQASQIVEILEKMINHVANKKHKELIEPVYAKVKNTLGSSVEPKSLVSG